MSTRSRPSPSTVDGPFKSVDPKLFYFSPKAKTLRVGASSTVYRGPTLRAGSATELNAASYAYQNPADVYDIEKSMFSLLVGGAWHAADPATRSQMINNDKHGYEIFAKSLTKNIEDFANGKPSYQTRVGNLEGGIDLDIDAPPRANPVGTVSTLVPVNPDSLEPTVRFKWNDARDKLEAVDLELPGSFLVSLTDPHTRERTQTAMTPRQNSWAPVADNVFFPMQTDCEDALVTMVRDPTEDNEAAAAKSIKEAARFFADRQSHYNTDIYQVRPQYPDQQPDESAQSQSLWKFGVRGRPRLKLSVKPITGLNCVPRGVPHMFRIDGAGEDSWALYPGTADSRA
jgi:hypothetical protein